MQRQVKVLAERPEPSQL